MHTRNIWAERKRRASERGRRMARARWDRPQPTREADADTLRRRALDDRRGPLYAEIVRHTEEGPRRFALRWSCSGRTDQLDIWEDGRRVATIRPSAALQAIDACIG